MGNAIRISDKLVNDARLYSKVENRSVTGQIEYWAKIGKLAEENPELTFSILKAILLGKEELQQGLSTDYKFE